MTNTDAITEADKFSPYALPEPVPSVPFPNPPISPWGRVAHIDINLTGEGEVVPTDIIVSGTISAQNGTNINASQVGVFLIGGSCETAGETYTCYFPESGEGTIVFAYYNTPTKNNAACDITALRPGNIENDGNPSTETTSFEFRELEGGSNTTMNIVISKQNNC